MLPSYPCLAPIFFTKFYLACLIVTIVMTVGCNALIDWLVAKGEDDHYVATKNFVFNCLIFNVVVCFLVFWGTGGLRQRILDGISPPVKSKALQDSWFKKYILFSMVFPAWKGRFWRFMLQSVYFPTVPTIVCVYFFLWCINSFGELPGDAGKCSLGVYILATETWKSFVVGIIFSCNFAAAHNYMQPELHYGLVPEEDEDEKPTVAVTQPSVGATREAESTDVPPPGEKKPLL